jgi:hypothetical protein
MRCVEGRHRALPPILNCGGDAPVDAALGAVSMHDAGLHVRQVTHHAKPRGKVAGPDGARHGDARSAQGKLRGQRVEPLLLQGVERLRIADQPDGVAGARLRPREIAHVAERTAHRRADHVEDGEVFAQGFRLFAHS